MARAARSGTRADFVWLALAGAGSLLALVLPDPVRESTASGLRRTVVAPLYSIQRRAQLSRTAILSHESATLAVDSVAMRAMEAGNLEAENVRLRSLLGLAHRLRWGFVPAEALRGGHTREDYMLTLTAGSNAGVQRYSPVVAPEGLVGMVQAVDPTTSLAISWSHPDFRVSAMTADGSIFGIVAAHLGGGPERYMLELRGIPFRSSLARGTLVLSSGLGGTYPRGIPIGIVQGELETAEGWARTYLIRPAVVPSEVTSVMILTAPRVAQGVQNVWSSRSAVDSATQGVVTAGDSVARVDSAAVRAARARSAASDSARGVTAQPGTPAAPASRDSAARRATVRDTSARAGTRPATRDTGSRPRVPAATATPTVRPETSSTRPPVRPDTSTGEPR